ncbi:MAG TPA: EamA family transporter [Saprospiraceae bacterium]|nr:EamA family transporter [Saprospiraceae bacterium]HRV87386.1 EamA family transporter [Saprospiraceae bacterium]
MNWKSGEKRAYLELHIAVVLFGFTAILGDLITLPSLTLVWWRVFLASISLYLIIRPRQTLQKLSRRAMLRFIGIGFLAGLHWVAFFGSVKLSNASITLVTLASGALFASMLEPWFFRKKVAPMEVLLGLMVIPGMYLVVSSIDFSMWAGIAAGLVASLLAVSFSVLNKNYIKDSDALTITFLEMSGAWILVSILLPIVQLVEPVPLAFWPRDLDWVYLLILALVCTTLGYAMSLNALNHLSAFTTSLALNMEPVYGIILAWLILRDNKELNSTFYLGVIVILLAIFSHPFLKKQLRKKQAR